MGKFDFLCRRIQYLKKADPGVSLLSFKYLFTIMQLSALGADSYVWLGRGSVSADKYISARAFS